jgi:phosphoglycolate phosphatase-like HAD superfamily hydrolase
VPLDREAYVELFLRDSRGAWDLLRERGVGEAEIQAARAARDDRYVELLGVAAEGREGGRQGVGSPYAVGELGSNPPRGAGDLLMPGAAAGVAALAARFRLAIVTSSEPGPFAAVHARTGLLRHFELALTREQYVNAKPDPEPYLAAAARLGVPPSRCLVVEDSERGLRAARSAGIACWVVPSELTRGGRFDGAEAVLDDLGDVVRRLSV